VAYAASQLSDTPQIDWLVPRSTSSHCGSLNALDQRVAVLPSVAAEAGNCWPFSSDEAVVGWFSAMSVVPQDPASAGLAACAA
jgi:hypothetical protein